ncbi:MAG: DNA adenine methylase [Muribaculaceae bacterium]|nr:DNA adenine methylase [Muribaculaceae bacterium]
MESKNKMGNLGWSGNYENVFAACKDVFSINPHTGKVYMKSDKEYWNNLVDVIIKNVRGIGERETFNSENAQSGLRFLIPYSGGKTSELKYIYPNLPSYDRYFEPFVGGGSVFMGINANEYYINDFSSDLITLYRNIASLNRNFCHYAELIDMTIKKAIQFRDNKLDILLDIHKRYRTGILTDVTLDKEISSFCKTHSSEINEITNIFPSLPSTLLQEMRKSLYKIIQDMNKSRKMVQDKVSEYFLTAIQKSLYIHYRNLFNNKELKETNPVLYSTIFLYIRERVFRGGSNYNQKGELNSSYNGYKHNYRLLTDTLDYYHSAPVMEHFRDAHIYNMDFEDFLQETNPTENDFIFLDPPYDETISTYHGNEFNQDDHRRLANYLLNDCKAKWMMIIKKTDFIFNLYNKKGIYMKTYNKTYNSGTKKGKLNTHLLITNYPPKSETYRRAA